MKLSGKIHTFYGSAREVVNLICVCLTVHIYSVPLDTIFHSSCYFEIFVHVAIFTRLSVQNVKKMIKILKKIFSLPMQQISTTKCLKI